MREKELSLEYKAKELKVHNAKTHTIETSEVPFDVGKISVDSSFSRWINILCILKKWLATSLKWPVNVWVVLLQNVFVGKAHKIYSAIPMKHSARYQIVKDTVLNAYKQVPEAYRQKFRSSTKNDKQTYVEFAVKRKGFLIDAWCTSLEVESNFTRLHELLLIEEFKNCLVTQ